MLAPSPGKNPWTLTFTDPNLEGEFQHELENRRPRRGAAASFAVAALCWICMSFVDRVVLESTFVVVLHASNVPLMLVLGALQLREPFATKGWPAIKLISSIVPGASLVIALWTAGIPFAQLGSLVMATYMIVLQVYTGLRAYQAALLGLVLTTSWSLGLIRAPLAVVLVTALPVAATYLLAVQIGRQQERSRRRDFVARRTIESLLKREISHQVAERSKALGEQLASLDVALPSVRLEADQTFAERYRIVRELGKGAMGAVYEVERLTDQQTFALKVITGHVSGAQAARFAREAEIGSRVRHPNLISIVDVGVSPAGTPFLVMELARGGTLEDQRQRFGDAAWAVPVLAQVAAGLSALHQAGVVHRDLKPQNILLEHDAVRISDFGISRFGVLERSSDPYADTAAPSEGIRRAALTRTGAVIGTPLYMAPEAPRGVVAIGAPADIFAFGLIAYEVLTAKLAYESPVVMSGYRPPPSLPGPLGPLVRACLEEQPERRPTSAQLVAQLASLAP